MSEQQENATNVWEGPQVSSQPGPVPPREPAHDQTSASERAFAEGWPAQPGWVPEGGVGAAWGVPQQYDQPAYGQPAYGQTAHGQPAYGQQYAQPQQGQTWVPQQAPYAEPGVYGTSPGQPGYPPAAGMPYPGPDAPLPRSNSTTVLVSVVVAVLLVAAAVGGIVLVKRGSSDKPVAAPSTAAAGGAPNGSAPGGRTESSGKSGGSAGGATSGTTGGSTSGSTGGSSSGTSTTPPMTGSTSIDLTTVHVPAYAASPDANDVAHTLDAYFTGINSADYATAYAQLSPAMQAKNPYAQFRDNTAGTIDSDVTLTDVTVSGDGSGTAAVTFTSTQPGDKGVVSGQTCTNWSITYTLQLGGGAGGWLLTGTPSAQHTGC